MHQKPSKPFPDVTFEISTAMIQVVVFWLAAHCTADLAASIFRLK
jgi:hypothetical protein